MAAKGKNLHFFRGARPKGIPMAARRIAIVGAGPGGLSAAMILAYRGYDVTVFEKEAEPGGRNRPHRVGPYTFDTGPTFLMMTFVLRSIFELAGRRLEDYVEVQPLEPMYRLSFPNLSMSHTADPERMQGEVDRAFPGNGRAVAAFLSREKERYRHIYPCMTRPYDTPWSMAAPTVLKALPHLSLGKSIFGALSRYFTDKRLVVAFTFQSKYLGMSPWECPALFAMIPYVEHALGIDYVRGGLHRISAAMADIAREHGADVRLATPVSRIVTRNGLARGVRLENGELVEADAVLIGADFGYSASHLFEPGELRTWTPTRLRRTALSSSTFMLYLGLDVPIHEPHHHIVFARDYRRSIDDIVLRHRLPTDFSFYLNNASALDSGVAPPGHSALYVLVPVPNQRSGIAWSKEETAQFRGKIVRTIAQRTSLSDIERHIVAEDVITPRIWEQRYHLLNGATFSLSHSLSQLLYFRPHNRFEDVGRCYLAGGGTHPGSGLPTIYESGRISADLISRDLPG